ncbi:MAG: hypothetical protein NT007_06220 [Candidatus Kapabacteria bacterium]|nr:hypothetical protein [Candidatus Kapabacteria bacterium]
MKEEQSYNGYWWLPESPDDKIPGIITIKNDNWSKLELFGAFSIDKDKLFKRIKHSIILGIFSQTEYLTLVNSDGLVNIIYDNNYDLKFYKSNFECIYTIKNSHFNDFDKIKFDKFTLYFDCLNDWVNIEHPISHEFNKNQMSFINNKTEPIIIDINESLKMSFEFVDIVIGPLIHEHMEGYKKETSIQFTSLIPLTLNDCEILLRRIQDFLSFAIQKPVYHSELYAISIIDQSILPRFNKFSTVKLFIRARGENFEYKKKFPSNMMFTFNCINEVKEIFFQNWINNIDKFDLAYHLYFAVQFNSSNYLESKFLSYIQAIEGFHRRLFNDFYIQDENDFKNNVFEIMKSAIPQSLDIDLQNKLIDTLKHSNEFSLRKRLKGILSGISTNFKKNLIINYDNEKEFIDKVVYIRNYFSHILDDTINFEDPKYDLYEISRRLKVILEYCLLKALKLDQEKIEELLNTSLSFD